MNPSLMQLVWHAQALVLPQTNTSDAINALRLTEAPLGEPEMGISHSRFMTVCLYPAYLLTRWDSLLRASCPSFSRLLRFGQHPTALRRRLHVAAFCLYHVTLWGTRLIKTSHTCRAEGESFLIFPFLLSTVSRKFICCLPCPPVPLSPINVTFVNPVAFPGRKSPFISLPPLIRGYRSPCQSVSSSSCHPRGNLGQNGRCKMMEAVDWANGAPTRR
jgi:hypothetical protein